jgi:protocatechuate 3,4-dioxygenase beta subunit
VVFQEWDKATEAYQRLADSDPADAAAAFGLGLAGNGAGRYEQAIAPLRRAIELGKRDWEAYSQLGRAEIHARQPEPAALSMAKAIELGDPDPITRYNLACAYALTDRTAEALTSLKQAFAMGLTNATSALTDADLAGLHSSPAFRDLIREHQRSHTTRLVTSDEPGEAMIVFGQVVDDAGNPIPQVLIYVFHADIKGEYTRMSPMDEPNARIFGYLRTDRLGRYEFRTTRPGGYQKPVTLDGKERLIPQHIHFEVTAPGFQPRRFQMVFDDDPRMDEHWRSWAAANNFPVVQVTRDPDGTQRCSCDITLSKGSATD